MKRYRTVLDKFLAFAKEKGIRHWQQVNKDALGRYGKWLEDQDYHDKTQYIELTVLKQVIKWMVSEQLLPTTSLVAMKLKKPQGTTAYCCTREQVQAIIAFCRERSDLDWLADVVVALATTGLRISELAGLHWSDVDMERGILRLKDTSRKARQSKRQEARTTKSHRDHSLPVHEELIPVLRRLPRLSDGRVFHGPKGGKLKPDTVRNILKREVLPTLAEKFPPSGDDPGIAAGRLHSFRHYFLLNVGGHRRAGADADGVARPPRLRHGPALLPLAARRGPQADGQDPVPRPPAQGRRAEGQGPERRRGVADRSCRALSERGEEVRQDLPLSGRTRLPRVTGVGVAGACASGPTVVP